MAEKELVLELGVEGGSATVYRTALVYGGWQFHVEGSSIYLDENDFEDWRSWRSEPFLSIEEALESFAKDGSWVLFYPVTVHPDFRPSACKLAQEVASKLPEELREMWKRRWKDWQQICQQEP